MSLILDALKRAERERDAMLQPDAARTEVWASSRHLQRRPVRIGIILVLLVRPQGIFGRVSAARP